MKHAYDIGYLTAFSDHTGNHLACMDADSLVSGTYNDRDLSFLAWTVCDAAGTLSKSRSSLPAACELKSLHYEDGKLTVEVKDHVGEVSSYLERILGSPGSPTESQTATRSVPVPVLKRIKSLLDARISPP